MFDLTQKLLAASISLGATWVMWLLIGLSCLSVAVAIERAVYFLMRGNSAELPRALAAALGRGDLAGARRLCAGERLGQIVGAAGLAVLDRGARVVGEALAGARARERARSERFLVVLGTLGNNAPFIGLFGTVLGIIKAFHDLGRSQAGGAGVVMQGISEALVATAVGLMVAIPAVVAYNAFMRVLRGQMARADEIAHLILAHAGDGGAAAEAVAGDTPAPLAPDRGTAELARPRAAAPE
ncbi:MAG TPA: MotA/TolQ/ExbB proton channel family protein [Polyangia bacterium]